MIDRKVFSDRLKSRRTQRQATMVDVARALCVSKQSVHQWEIMRTLPSLDKLAELADFLDCSIDYLVGRTDASEHRS